MKKRRSIEEEKLQPTAAMRSGARSNFLKIEFGHAPLRIAAKR